MTKVQELMSMLRGMEGCSSDITLPVLVDEVYLLGKSAWHVQLADQAIDEGNVLLAKNHIKSAIAAVKEFNK